MILKSNILLEMNAILAMVEMEITTDSIHCTGNIGWLQTMQQNNEFQR